MISTGDGFLPERPQSAVDRFAYQVHGTGDDAILFIHGSFMEDALVPLLNHRALRGRRRIHYDRPGYGDSPARDEAFSFQRGAADALALLQRLDIVGANVVGYSLGGVIALELARSASDAVSSLVLIEPPLPLAGLSEGPPPQFLIDAAESWQAGDHEAAVNTFWEAVASPSWRSDIADALPEGLEQVSRNAHLFFERELPAFEDYLITQESLAGVTRPILYIVGDSETDYGSSHDARMELMKSWLPQTETFVVPRADHGLPLQRPEAIAGAIARFLERNPD